MDHEVRIAALRREIDAAQRELYELIRSRAGAGVEDVELAGPEGPIRLSACAAPGEVLLVEFDPGADGFPVWSDAAAAMAPHLDGAALIVVSPDPPAALRALAAERGWRVPVYSHAGTALARQEGFVRDDEPPVHLPGLVIYRRAADGLVRLASWAHAPGDPFCGLFHYAALLP